MTNNKYPDIQLANFRDLGGYRNTDGYTVKDNKIFRSPCLADLSEQTKQALDGLGIEYVLDPRAQHICTYQPHAHAAKWWSIPRTLPG